MTIETETGFIPREEFDRERRAREAAEAELEARTSALREAEERLLREREALRAALAETETARARETAALEAQSILARALEALSGRTGASEAMQALLDTLRDAYGCTDACYLQAHGGGGVRVAAAARRDRAGTDLPLPPVTLCRARRMAGLAPAAGDARLPEGFAGLSTVLIVPLGLHEETAGALLLCGAERAPFTAADLRLMERVAAIAVQTLTALREARRHALLVALIEGRAVEETDGVLDAPLEAVHRAFRRLTDIQGEVVGILGSLLDAARDGIDAALDRALARLGRAIGADRVRLLRLAPGEMAVQAAHLWCADGVAADDAGVAQGLAAWHARLAAEEDVLIPDAAALPEDSPERAALAAAGTRALLAVPMRQDGVLRGVLSCEAMQAPRSFLPGEVHLIRSVAKVADSLLARREAEAAAAAAHAETAAERARLESVLEAMPDLVVELDGEGRFVTWYSGTVTVPDEIGAAFADQTLEAMLPPELAAEARAVLAEIDAGGTPEPRDFALDVTREGARRWQLSASANGTAGYLFVLRDVTEAHEQTARIAELSEIAQRTSNLVVISDAARRITWVNRAFEETSGWSLEEVKGRSAGSFLQSAETDPETIAHLRAALDAGEPVQAEILNRAKDGRPYWIWLDIQPLRGADGTLEGFMAVETDVTERRAQSDALRRAAEDAAQARATLEAAVEALQDGFVLFDADDRLVICNERYRQIYPRSAPAIVPGATFEEILRYGLARGEYAEAAGREEAWLAERLEHHRASESEIEQELADGRWLRIFEKATPDGGRVGLRVDVTALKLAEKRAQADRAAAMEASQDGMAITDAEGRFLYMNRAHLELFGYESETEVIGKSWRMLYPPAAAAWIETHAMPEIARTGRFTGEIEGVARDGTPVDQEVSLALKSDGGLVCTTRDMRPRRREASERARLHEELQLARRREVVGQMAAGLAHDFNNLLAAISGSAFLIQDTAPGTVAEEAARRIEAATQGAGDLVKRLLTLGRGEAARERIDLCTHLREAADLIRAGLRAPARLALELPDAPVEVEADPTDILQLVLNLGINARDALGDGAGEITIALDPAESADLSGPFALGRPDPARRYCRITVSDTGVGMTPETAARVFEPYATSKGADGSGLGLAIVSSVVAAAGGAIRLDSRVGEGTTFAVLWPVTPAAAHTAPESGTGRLDGRAVLLVDDQQDVLDGIASFLEAAGAEVAPSDQPQDILDALEEDPGGFDLLITDFDMPDLDGAALARAARERAPGLPVVLVTALADLPGRHDGLFDAVLGKPVQREALVAAAETAILKTEDRGASSCAS
jgi:PAS domain S-box-containing protein